MKLDLTEGNITKTMLRFAFPMIVGNLLQQLYNVADTLIVGRFLGPDALAAVGSAYTLMTFLTSIFLGLCMGSGAVFSIRYGERNMERLKISISMSFFMIAVVTAAINIVVFAAIDPIMRLLHVPDSVYPLMREYLWIIFIGISASFLYNYFASLLRAVGNSVAPLVFLLVSSILNIGLDLWFVLGLNWGVAGAAAATVLSQYVSGIGILIYTVLTFHKTYESVAPQDSKERDKIPDYAVRPTPQPVHRPIHAPYARFHIDGAVLKEIAQFSFLTCIQQSVMNFGILMVQGLVNSFGPVVMAAFAAAVKIDSFAYMPVQDFGNAFSTFIAQNYGAGKKERIQKGISDAVRAAMVFCLFITAVVCLFAKPLMMMFVRPEETEILAVGVHYLRIEGAFYCGIGGLFLLYGFYRAVRRPGMSVVLTVISLGTRVVLAYVLSAVPALGVTGIWVSVPIGWILADCVGYLYYRVHWKECNSSDGLSS